VKPEVKITQQKSISDLNDLPKDIMG